MVQLVIRAKDINIRGQLFYILSRSRDLGEYVPIYTSEKKKYEKVGGIVWDEHDFMMKELTRNDDTK